MARPPSSTSTWGTASACGTRPSTPSPPRPARRSRRWTPRARATTTSTTPARPARSTTPGRAWASPTWPSWPATSAANVGGVGEDRAETYLRLAAEARLGRAGRSFRDVRASVEQVRWAGEVLVAAGALTEDQVRRIAAEHDAALSVRAGAEPASRLGRAMWQLDDGWPQAAPSPAAAQPMRVTPVGATLRVTGGRAPTDLHLMTLVGAQADAVITVAMTMRWPPDGSSADLESAGAGPEHLPYGQLWAVDDRDTRYRTLLVGEGRSEEHT